MNKENTSIKLSDISPGCLVRDVLHNIWMVIFAVIIGAMGSFLYLRYFHQPEYTASMTYAVTSKKTESYYTSSNLKSAKEVAAVLSELIESDVITREVRKTSDKLSGFDGKFTAVNYEESNFINVSAVSSTPEDSFRALLALVDIFPSLSDYISDTSVIQVIRNPSISSFPSNYLDKSRICMISSLACGAAVVAAICFFSVLRGCVQTRDGARHLLDSPVLGVISHEKKKRTLRSFFGKSKTGLQIFSPTTSFTYTEQINSICAQLEHERITSGRKVIMITGVGENEGKSTVAANIAAALALKGLNVAIVDADLRKPSLNLFFDRSYTAEIPLNELLSHPLTKESVFKCIQRHDKLGLYMLFSYKPDARCTELISGKNMNLLLRKIRIMDYVILDTPPMGMFTDAEALTQFADASVLVVRQNYTPACDINDAIDSLRAGNAEYLGCILNDMRATPSLGSYAYGKKYGYGYGYGKTSSVSRSKNSR